MSANRKKRGTGGGGALYVASTGGKEQYDFQNLRSPGAYLQVLEIHYEGSEDSTMRVTDSQPTSSFT